MPTNRTDSPARIFVSCGQSENSDEIGIAGAVGTELRQLGFEPWIAVANQTLSGIQEFVFDALKNSEYFIFLDFKRERLEGTSFRGSLFSHQELAIASFLGLELLAFRESGTKLEGLLAFVGPTRGHSTTGTSCLGWSLTLSEILSRPAGGVLRGETSYCSSAIRRNMKMLIGEMATAEGISR
jgi:hypothetical protein